LRTLIESFQPIRLDDFILSVVILQYSYRIFSDAGPYYDRHFSVLAGWFYDPFNKNGLPVKPSGNYACLLTVI
jgi:hypothetical protein